MAWQGRVTGTLGRSVLAPLVLAAVLVVASVPAAAVPLAPAASADAVGGKALPPAKAYVLVDVTTGNVLAAHNEHERLRPASLTKLLTALIAVTYLPAEATIAGTKQSWDAYPDKVGIERGVAWPLEEVLQALLVMSANDAAYAIAQRVSGSLGAFGAVMDRSARQIGMSDDPVFHDPAGLDGSEGVGGGNYVSARDLAIAGRDVLKVPVLAKIVKELSYHFVDPTGQAHWLSSANYAFLSQQPGAIGVKTGFTDAAGYCVMGAATRRGRTMLAVVMDGYNPNQTAMDLVNDGFATPVAEEPTAGRLPPPALPTPPATKSGAAAANGAHEQTGLASSGLGRTSHRGAPSSSAPGPAPAGPGEAHNARRATAGPRSSRLLASAAASPAASRGPRGGLGAVVGTLPGTLLVLAAATACLVGLAEALKLNRLRRAQPLALRTTRRTTAWVTTLGGSRRHRDDLVASYSRHERHPDPRRLDH